MKKAIYLFSILTMGLSSVTAQTTDGTIPSVGGNPNAKSVAVGNAIQKFKTSDFMVRFSDFKNQMETDARDFVARQNAYSVKDVRRVQMSYDKTAAKFNQIMLEIKQDFMDKEKVKMINKFPDMYANGLKGKIDGLEDFYKANFQQTLSDVTEKDGSALLLVLVDLIKAAGELSQHFKTLRYEKEYMSDQYIQQNLVAPNKLPSWTELSSSVSVRTDVRMHPSRDGSAANNNNNNGNNDNNGGNNGNNNGDNNNGGNVDNGGNGDGGTKRIPKPADESHNEKGDVVPADNATDGNTEFGVEGRSTIKQPANPKDIKKKPVVSPNTEGVKKVIKQ